MARLCAAANGDNTSAATWGVINATSYVEANTTSTIIPTTYATTYAQFTPGAITVDGLAVRLSARNGTAGTFSVDLYNHTAAASVAGSEVTIDANDVGLVTSANDNGGWYFFKFSSALTLIAANAYSVRKKTSVSSQLSFAGSSATAPSRFLRTTTTAAPVAGDDRFVIGEWTGAGAMTTRTVTLNDVTVVDYGSAATSIVTPALSICKGGIVLADTTASTNFTQKVSGNIVIYSGGTFNVASAGTPYPTTSTFTLNMDCVANVDFGIMPRYGSIMKFYGEARQRWTLLTSNEAAAATVIQVVSTAGWKAGDTLVFTPTGVTAGQGETKVIQTVDSSTQVTLTTGLSFAHTGTGDVVGEVGNLTSNVKIRGTSASVGTYVNVLTGADVALDNVEVQYYGSTTTNKRGVVCLYTAAVGQMVLNSCAFKNGTQTTATVGSTENTGIGQFTITDNVVYSTIANASGAATITTTLTNGSDLVYDFTGNLIAGSGVGTGFILSTYRSYTTGVIDNNRVAGFQNGVNSVCSNTTIPETYCKITNLLVHSCSTGMNTSGSAYLILEDSIFVRNTSIGITGLASSGLITNCSFIGNATAGISSTTTGALGGTFVINTSTFRGATGFNQAAGLAISNAGGVPNITFNSCNFGQTVGHTTADINVTAMFYSRIVFNNCNFFSANEVNAVANTLIGDSGGLFFQKIDGVAGAHRSIVTYNTITPDAAIFSTAAPSLRMTPKSTTVPANSKEFMFRVSINSGESCAPSVKVRQSVVGDGAAYNGSFAKLYLKSNPALGFSSDTLIDTASGASSGAFEILTGSTATVTDEGVLEFYITCSGTAGWLNIDDFSYVNS